ncbi:MAG: hypothetical protein IJ203_00290, partial [Atopobiaceae bacterium]|nr:hypothetical protein [Atopobiaceae bacterium]
SQPCPAAAAPPAWQSIISLLAAGPLLSVFGIRGLSFACAAAQAVTLAVLVAGMARLTAQQAGRRRTLVANRQ